jgi:hypothetical protein
MQASSAKDKFSEMQRSTQSKIYTIQKEIELAYSTSGSSARTGANVDGGRVVVVEKHTGMFSLLFAKCVVCDQPQFIQWGDAWQEACCSH